MLIGLTLFLSQLIMDSNSRKAKPSWPQCGDFPWDLEDSRPQGLNTCFFDGDTEEGWDWADGGGEWIGSCE